MAAPSGGKGAAPAGSPPVAGAPRLRIAPSPTGDPHVGTAYIALFNLAYARQQGGRFILRIEDTDRTRSTRESEAMIFQSLRWLGLLWDEGPDIGGPYAPYRQSERAAIYQAHAEHLVESGGAYRCFCAPERLAELRRQQEAAKQPTGYDRHCRTLPPEEVARQLAGGAPYTIRLKMPLEGETVVDDLVRGEVRFQNALIQDTILLKSDGFPTYHLANVVDDHLMEITLVARAEEWISSLPIHVQLYRAFGWEPPRFAHMPLLRNKDRSKISKRKNPTSLRWYQAQGYLPEALLNFLGLMGWSMPDGREIFSFQDMVEAFRWDRVVKSGPVFDLDKLGWLNGIYIRSLCDEEFLQRLRPYVTLPLADSQLARIAPLLKDRVRTLSEFNELAAFFVNPPTDYHPKLVAKNLTPAETADLLTAARELLAQYGAGVATLPWEAGELERTLTELAGARGLKRGDLFMSLRVAITGSNETPPLFETMVALGRDETLARLDRAIAWLRSRA